MSRFEAALRTQRGEPRWWDTVVSAISGPDGRPEKLLALSRDVSERRTSEQALRESETRYRTLFEAIEAGFCVVEVIFSSDGRPVDHLIVEANPAFEHQTGLSNVVGRRASELAPGTEQNWNDLYGRVALSGKPERIEGANAALGRWFDVHVSRAAAPRQHRVAVLFNDITLRKAAEKELRESETRRGAALSIAKLGTFEWDCVTGRVTLDERGRQIFGLWGDEGVTAAQIFDRMHPDDVSRVRDEARDATAAGRHIEIAYRIVLPDGETRTVSSHGEPIGGDDDGEQMRMVGVFRDVTEQARAQAALEESEARLRELNETLEAQVELRTAELRLARDIIEANASPICAFDTEYRLIAFNRAHSDEFFCIFATGSPWARCFLTCSRRIRHPPCAASWRAPWRAKATPWSRSSAIPTWRNRTGRSATRRCVTHRGASSVRSTSRATLRRACVRRMSFPRPRMRCARARRWRRWASSPAAWRTTSTIC
jgi:PAS domain S-box-containing protein